MINFAIMKKTGVLLLNLGTPDSPNVKDVRKYLREFLMDEKVIDIPFLNRWLLVNLIIAPFRSPKSAIEYKKVWTKEGSPLKVYGEKLVDLVQHELGENYKVVLGMRYQNPSIKDALLKFNSGNINKIITIPLYPQYADATTLTSINKVNDVAKKINLNIAISFVNNFYNHPSFIETHVLLAKEYISKNDYEHYVFSYHGLPERQIIKANSSCKLNNECCKTIDENNQNCYRAQCYETTRLIAKKLGLNKKDYTVCFQSRLGKAEWIKPYTEDVIHQLSDKKIKKVLAFSPAFVADCLETTIEVGQEYKEEFIKLGGETWDLVESLNTHPNWVKTVTEIVKSNE